jgi:hypothetical protein
VMQYMFRPTCPSSSASKTSADISCISINV